MQQSAGIVEELNARESTVTYPETVTAPFHLAHGLKLTGS
jgi:hypothetical protein